MFRTLFALLMSGLLSGCASLPTEVGRKDTLSDQKKLSFFVSSNRYSEMEPCGCNLYPDGGLKREWNYLQSHRGPLRNLNYYFASGTTFTPLTAKEINTPGKVETFRTKALHYTKALNELGLDALSPSIDDFALGENFLRELSQRAQFAMVSTNLVSKKSGQPIFPRYLELNQGELLVFGVSHSKARYGKSTVKVQDPVKSIRAVLAKLPKKPRLIAVLSSLKKKQQDRLISEIPEIHMVFGSFKSTKKPLEVINRHTLIGSPMDQTKSLLKVDLDLNWPTVEFYDEENGVFARYFKKQHDADIAKLREQLEDPKLSPAKRAKVEKRIAYFKGLIQRGLATEIGPNTTVITFKHENLTEDYESPSNKMGQLTEAYKNSLREIAVSEKK